MNSTKLYSEKLVPTFEIKKNDPFSKSLLNFKQVKEILNEETNNKMKILYFNRKRVHCLLYENDEIIKIDSKIVNNKFSNYFYLALILKEYTHIVDYEYSIDLIREINNKLKNDNKLRNIILSKISIVLINYYKNIDNYDEDKEEEELEKIEKSNLDDIKNNLKELKEFKLIIEEIIPKKIDEIYISIINILIKTNKLDNFEYAYNIIKELDLEEINITEKMFDELSKTLDINKDYIQKYIILDKKDFSFNKEIINFYYILFKYILKESIYIYNIELLLKARKSIIQIIKKYSDDLFSNNIINENKEKMEYIIYFITDLKYYNNLYLSASQKNSLSFSFEKNKSKNSIYSNSTFNSSKFLKNSNSFNIVNVSNDIDTYLSIIKFEQILKNKKKRYATFIKEMSNGTIIIGGPNDVMFFYDKNLNFINRFSNYIEIMESLSKEKEKNKKIDKKTQNIFETNFSKENKKDDLIDIFDCSKYALIQYSIQLDYYNNNIRITDPCQIFLPSEGCFEINNSSGNNEYVIFGPKGIYHFCDSPFDINPSSDEELEKYNKNKTNFKAGIKINDNYIALTSNKIIPNGEDKLVIYDTKNKLIIKKIFASFVVGVNGIELIEIEEENKKFLLCGCKKYISGQENGIMIIDAEIKEEEEELKYKFYNTNNFEVNCFCQINIKNIDNTFKKTNYFFVGGFENERRCGMIQLYRINYDNKNNLNNFEIEYLQEIEVDISNEFQSFEGTINTIMQTKTNGKFLVSCLDGYIYCFSEPNINFYLEKEENLQ